MKIDLEKTVKMTWKRLGKNLEKTWKFDLENSKSFPNSPVAPSGYTDKLRQQRKTVT